MSSVAGSVDFYLPFFKKNKINKILDYGAGKLRNSRYLFCHGFKVFASDLPEQLERLRGENNNLFFPLIDTNKLRRSNLNVDAVISTFVFNIITDEKERKLYLDNIVKNLRANGYLLIEVKCRKNKSSEKCHCSGCYKCPNCIKSYSREELDQIIIPYGFMPIGQYHGRRCSLGVLYKKKKIVLTG